MSARSELAGVIAFQACELSTSFQIYYIAVRTSTEVSSIPRILLKEISIVYLDFLSFPLGSCRTDNFSFGTLQD